MVSAQLTTGMSSTRTSNASFSSACGSQANVFNGLAEETPKRKRGGQCSDVAAQVDQCPAPAPLGTFLYAKPENSDRNSPLLFFSVFLNASTPVFPPAPSRRSGQAGLFGKLLTDFPWPRYNPGLKAFLDLLAVNDAGTIRFSRSLRVNGFVSSNIDSGALLPSRGPMRPAWFSPDRLSYGWRGQSRRSRLAHSRSGEPSSFRSPADVVPAAG